MSESGTGFKGNKRLLYPKPDQINETALQRTVRHAYNKNYCRGEKSNEKTIHTKMIFFNLVPTFPGCAAAPRVTKKHGAADLCWGAMSSRSGPCQSGRADKVEALKIKAPITTERPAGFK